MPELYQRKIDQIPQEIDAFIDILRRERAKSYLEIGSQYGGSLWRVATALPVGSRIVSVDLPHGNKETEAHLRECCADLKALGYDAHLITDDSTKPEVIWSVELLGPFDAIFIDGNHTLPMVTQDWQNYRGVGKIIAFHDIAWDKPTRPGRLPIEVKALWDQIKKPYRHQEIIANGSDKGIGVIWRG